MIVDVHAHVAYPELGKRYPIPPNLLDIDGMIERKAAAGIDVTIVGSPTGAETFMAVPGVDPFAQPMEDLARHHEWLAQLVADHGGRLAAYAFVNPFGGSRMLDQVAADVRNGGFVGLIVNTSVEGRYLSDPAADDFFAMADELGVPLFLHPPVRPVGTESLVDMRVVEQVLRFVEVSTGLAAMIFAGRFERYPGLRVLAATAGGALGILAGRLEAAFSQPAPPFLARDDRITRSPREQLAAVYVDTANLNPHSQLANLELLGTDHLLFGTDSPPSPIPPEVCVQSIRGLPIDEPARAAILGENAARLFGLSPPPGR